MTSQKLKKAVAMGKVVAVNPNSGEVKVFLYDSAKRKQFSVDIPPVSEVELAPRLCTARDILLSRNLDSLLSSGQLRLKS